MSELTKGAGKPGAAPAAKPAAKPLTDAEKTIQEIADIKANMVPKADYDRVVSDRDKFKNALLTGAADPSAEPQKSAAELRKQYAEEVKDGVTNVKGFETALKLRDAVILETGIDPFMTEALNKIDPDFGERVAEGLGDLLERSEGQSMMFNALLSQNLK